MNSIQGNGSTLHVVGECVNRIGKDLTMRLDVTAEEKEIIKKLGFIDYQMFKPYEYSTVEQSQTVKRVNPGAILDHGNGRLV